MNDFKPVIILGAGGHASVLIDALQQSSRDIMGITDPDDALWNKDYLGIEVLGDDEKILDIHPDRIELVNGLGSIKSTAARQKLFETWHNKGYSFASVIHPRAIVAPSVKTVDGVQILAGAIINANTMLGANTIVNSGVVLEHDCIIGHHVHLAPGATIAGNVSIGNSTHVGLGSTILQGLTIGDNCLIAAGAVVVKLVPSGSTAMGVPAKITASKAG